MRIHAALRLAFVAATACAPAPRVASPPSPSGIHRFRVGALDAVALDDGAIDIPNDGKTLGLGHSVTEVGDLLVASGLPREDAELRIQPLLVKDGPRVLLFDTGAAHVWWARAGHLPQSLAQAGVTPNDVTDVFLSHAHLDHIGGLLTSTGEIAFPNAVIHISGDEWAATGRSASSDPDASAVAHILSVIAPNVRPFEPGTKLLPEVTSVATFGHTRGHCSYAIESAGETLVYLGDVAHHSVVSVQRPGWTIDYDENPTKGTATRVAVLASLAHDGDRVYAVHFPFPGIGHVKARGEGFVWEPEP